MLGLGLGPQRRYTISNKIAVICTQGKEMVMCLIGMMSDNLAISGAFYPLKTDVIIT